jgi:hypothetical protein
VESPRDGQSQAQAEDRRQVIRIFVNSEEVRRLAAPLRVSDELMIVGALSEG